MLSISMQMFVCVCLIYVQVFIFVSAACRTHVCVADSDSCVIVVPHQQHITYITFSQLYSTDTISLAFALTVIADAQQSTTINTDLEE